MSDSDSINWLTADIVSSAANGSTAHNNAYAVGPVSRSEVFSAMRVNELDELTIREAAETAFSHE
jgi:hypothetical protein